MSIKERIRAFRDKLVDGPRSTMAWFCVALLYSIGGVVGIFRNALAGYFGANSPYPYLPLGTVIGSIFAVMLWFLFWHSYRKSLLKMNPGGKSKPKPPIKK